MSEGRKPVARLYTDGGGVVTRCSDPTEARQALIAALAEDDLYDAAALAEKFPIESAYVTRGRIVYCLPGSYGYDEGWLWQFHPGTGRGSTPAVEWICQ